MKDLNIEDKESFFNQLTKPLYKSNSSTCPLYKRSLITSRKIQSSKTQNSLKINILSHLNNLNSSKLSQESPIKFDKNNNSKNKDIKNGLKSGSIKNIFIFPEIKEFNLYYEIPFYNKYDFIFLHQGNLQKTDWLSKTIKLRSYPRYLKNTIFYQSNTQIQLLHDKNFSEIYEIYNKLKKSGLNLYNNKRFKECFEHFNYIYGLFKWIEFRDKNIKINEKINKENFVILDSDIEEKKIKIDLDGISQNNNIFKTCVIYILEIMAYCNMELRLYSEAVECLDECAILAKNYFPDIYLRRAQARIYNKKSTYEELKLAENDINTGIKLILLNTNNNINNSVDINIYYKMKNKLNLIINKRLNSEINYIKLLLKKNLYLNNNNNNIKSDDNVLQIQCNTNNNNINNISRYYKILKELKKKYILAFKFFNETKNYSQLILTYNEYETFYELYSKFKFFFKFSNNSLNQLLISKLSEKEKKNLYDKKNKNLIEKNRIKICEYIFKNGKYNGTLYKYVVDKILEEEKTKNEDIKLAETRAAVNSTFKGKCFFIKSSICFGLLILISVALQIYYLKSIRRTGSKYVYK